MKRGLTIALLCALFAGTAGYVAQRVAWGASDQENAYTRQLKQAEASGNRVEYRRLAGELAVTIAPREMLFTFAPPALILGAYTLLHVRRRRRALVETPD